MSENKSKKAKQPNCRFLNESAEFEFRLNFHNSIE